MTQHYVKNAEAFALVYSVTSRSSFKELSAFHQFVTQGKGGKEVPMVLVGNKIDLSNERTVKTEEGKRLAAEWNCKFVETSAKTKTNVFLLVEELLKEVERISPIKKKESWCLFL